MQNWENLWPNTIGKIEINPPVQLLAKQAEYFNEMMHNVLVAKIHSYEGKLGDGHSIVHELRIIASTFGMYSLTVLRMAHNKIDLYPVSIYDAIRDKKTEPIPGEKELKEVLRDVLGSYELNRAISAIKVQATFESAAVTDDLPF